MGQRRSHVLWFLEKKGEVPRFPQGPLPAFTPLHLQSAYSPLSGFLSLDPSPASQVVQDSRLLSLPAEIRLIIYKHVFASETIHYRSLDFESGVPYQRATAGSKAQLLLTCRKIADEATPSLYAHHVFRFSYAPHIRSPPASFPVYFLDHEPPSVELPYPSLIFGYFSRCRLALLSHVSLSYFLDHATADRLNSFVDGNTGSEDENQVLDIFMTEIVNLFRHSCPKMKSFTLELVTGSSPRLLQGYSTADIEFPEKTTTTGRFRDLMGFRVLEELKQMTCLEGGSVERLRLVAVTEMRSEGKTMQIVGAGSLRWHAIKYRLTDGEPVWVFSAEKNHKKR